MRISNVKAVLIAAWTCCCGVAFAADPYPLYGVGLGLGTATINNTHMTGAPTTVLTDSASAYSFSFDMRLSNWHAVEAEFVGMGDYSATGLTAQMTGYGISALGFMPFASKWSLYGKGGVTVMTSTLTPGQGYVLSTPSTETKTGLVLGLGVEYALAPEFALRLSMTNYPYSMGAGAASGRLAMYTLAAQVNFR